MTWKEAFEFLAANIRGQLARESGEFEQISNRLVEIAQSYRPGGGEAGTQFSDSQLETLARFAAKGGVVATLTGLADYAAEVESEVGE